MFSRIIRIAALPLCLCLSAWASAQTAVDINFATTYQTIRGFGTSTAWQPVLNATQANNLFGVGAGQIGLTIMRSRIDPSSTTGGSNWATELANAQQAQSINSQVIVFATPWTPPAAWKTNGSVDDGSLITSDYDNFANYLNAFIAYEKAGGVNLYAISVQNEPDYLPDYESCGYTGAQMDAFVAQEGGKINTRLMMPESDTFNTAESDPTLDDSNAVGYVSIVGGHTYGTAPFYYTNAKNKGKDVWMTETTYTPAAGSSAEPTISDAIAAAELYHQSMAVAQYNAYVYWWTPLLLNGNSPNNYAYALGQYSKFVRPGYVMNGANNNPASGIYVTSYSGSGKYVIVAINANTGSASLSFPMSGATVTSVTPYVTSGSEQLAQQSAMNVSNDSFTYSMPAQSIVTFVGTGSSSSSSFTLSNSSGSLSIAQGGSATDTITVTGSGGFDGSVTLAASGLPSGVTAGFGANPTSGSSVLTLTAGSTAAAGTSTITITGTSGSTTETTTIALTVTAKTAAGFTLASSPSSLSLAQGSSGNDTITVTDTGGFTGSVAFAATGLPSGVTASFSPASSTSSSALTLTAGSTAAAGTSTITITGTSGSTTETTTIALTVTAKTAAGFTLASSPSSLSLAQGSSGNDTITVTDTGGFTGSVAFAATGLPSGVTASFSPASSTSSSALTLTAGSTAAVGAYTVTITGTSGTTTASTSINLAVTSVATASACTVDYTVSTYNSSQFGANVTIKNGGSSALSGWSLTWSFANGQTITSSWNGAVSQSGANVTVSEQSGQTWENIPAGGSYTGFGFNGSSSGTNAVPTNFKLNGTACTIN